MGNTSNKLQTHAVASVTATCLFMVYTARNFNRQYNWFRVLRLVTFVYVVNVKDTLARCQPCY